MCYVVKGRISTILSPNQKSSPSPSPSDAIKIMLTFWFLSGKVNLTGDFQADQRRHSMMIEHINLMKVDSVFDTKAR